MKKLSDQQIICQQGVQLSGGRLLSLAFSFQATVPLDATALAEHRKFCGKTKKQRVKAVGKVLDGQADTCPACD